MNVVLCENCQGGPAVYTQRAVKLCRDCYFRDHAKRKAQGPYRLIKESETKLE